MDAPPPWIYRWRARRANPTLPPDSRVRLQAGPGGALAVAIPAGGANWVSVPCSLAAGGSIGLHALILLTSMLENIRIQRSGYGYMYKNHNCGTVLATGLVLWCVDIALAYSFKNI